MISIFFSSRFHSEFIKFFSVTPSAYQIPYSTLITGSYKHSAIQSSRSTLNDRMHLYDTPRDTMVKDSMLKSLCSTSTWNAPVLMPNISNYIFMCSRALCSTKKILFIMCFRVHAQHKHFINHVLQGPCPTKTSIYTYISSTIGLHPIYKTNHHIYMQRGP